MDLSAVASLPDAVKLNILSHLGNDGSIPSRAAPGHIAVEPPPPAVPTARPPAYVAPPADQLASTSLRAGIAVIDGFVNLETVTAVRHETACWLEQSAKAAGMGGQLGSARWQDCSYRGDRTAWVQPSGLREAGLVHLPALLERMLEQLRPWLAAQGLEVGGRTTCQLGHYPGAGARYVRHADWHPLTAPHRTATAICYLNPGWQPAQHGGQLCLYNHSRPPEAALAQAEAALCSGLDAGLPATVVAPLPGRLVVFDSRLVHEVLPCQGERMAVTCWFSRPGPAAAAAAATLASAQAGSCVSAQDVRAAAPTLECPRGDRLAEHPSTQLQGASLDKQQQPASILQHLQVPKLGSTPAAAATGCQPRPGHIFVSVASYRDSETQWMLADLFARAAHPERLRVGVVWQVDWQQDAHFVRIAPPQALLPGSATSPAAAVSKASDTTTSGSQDKAVLQQEQQQGLGAQAQQPSWQQWQRQVRQVILDSSEATGPCKARALAQQLWEGEEFLLQVDSHMRFAPGWDASLLRQLAQAEAAAGHGRVVLSTYPPGYQGCGPEAALPPAPLPAVLCASHFGPDGLLRLKARKLRVQPSSPVPSLFWAAGFSFSRAGILQAAPYRRDLPGLFFGEEVLQLLQLHRAGWRVFAPCEVVCYHLWSRAHRPTLPQQQQQAGQGAQQQCACQGAAGRQGCTEERARSQAAVRALLQGPEGAALGRQCGVDFCACTISAAALSGGHSEEGLL